MGADLGHALVGDDSDAVGVLDGREAMGDHHRRVLVNLPESVQGLLHNLPAQRASWEDKSTPSS